MEYIVMKNERHERILELIRENEIETQEELAAYLNRSGFAVTQATVSRDIRQLSLTKAPDAAGHMRYTVSPGNTGSTSGRFRRVLKDAFVSVDVSGNILVIHTVSGMAMSAAAALDSFGWKELLGSIAGDDTIMAVIRRSEDAETVLGYITDIVK